MRTRGSLAPGALFALASIWLSCAQSYALTVPGGGTFTQVPARNVPANPNTTLYINGLDLGPPATPWSTLDLQGNDVVIGTDGTEATTAWIAGNIAAFSASGNYAVTVNGNQSAAGLEFDNGNPTLSGGTITLTAPPVGATLVRVQAGQTATINSTVGGTSGFTKTGAGDLVVGGNIAQPVAIIVSEGTLTFNATQQLGSLNAASRAVLAANGNRTLYVNTLSVPGTLDMADNDLVVNNGNYSSIRALVLTGFGTSPAASPLPPATALRSSPSSTTVWSVQPIGTAIPSRAMPSSASTPTSAMPTSMDR